MLEHWWIFPVGCSDANFQRRKHGCKTAFDLLVKHRTLHLEECAVYDMECGLWHVLRHGIHSLSSNEKVQECNAFLQQVKWPREIMLTPYFSQEKKHRDGTKSLHQHGFHVLYSLDLLKL